MSEPEFDTWYTDEAVCPYCGDKLDCTYELIREDSHFEIEYDCEECGNSYIIEPEYSVSYTTRKKDDQT